MALFTCKKPYPVVGFISAGRILSFKFVLLLTILSNLIVRTIEAKDLTINTSTFYSNNAFYIDIQNASRVELPLKRISVRFADIMQSIDTNLIIPPGATQRFQLPFIAPTYPGTYNLSTWIVYLNDNIPLSVVGNTMFSFGSAGPINTKLTFKTEHIKRHGKITVEFQNSDFIDLVTPILPFELQIKSIKKSRKKVVYEIEILTPAFNNNYNAYWVIEKTEIVNGAQLRVGTFFPVQISTGGASNTILDWNFPSFGLLTTLWIVSLLLLIILSRKYYHGESAKKSTMYFLFYLFIIDLIVSVFQIPNLIVGSDYDYFRDIILPVYYTGLLGYGIFTTIQLQRADADAREIMLADKKIWIIFSFFESRMHRKSTKKNKKILAVPFDAKVKTSFLSFGVKFFFLPLLSSWAINNIFHVMDLIRDYKVNFYYINAMLIDIFILFDTSIFAFSYAIESKKLNSTIRSVEPTLIGWIVCLWCYPPFNHFSFGWLDRLIPFRSEWVLPEWALIAVLATIAFLWLIYVMATFALGLKSSNLTNRGTVSRFPYNLMRHPAYASKNLLWILSFLFLSNAAIPYGKYDMLSLGQVIGFVTIYYFRAITEERHLSRDPDYVKYKQKVRYRFIPGIW
jgi:protein-S-isoprenylcysteine O-methyltransferase Ste14